MGTRRRRLGLRQEQARLQNQKLVEQKMSSQLLQAMSLQAAAPLFGAPSEASNKGFEVDERGNSWTGRSGASESTVGRGLAGLK